MNQTTVISTPTMNEHGASDLAFVRPRQLEPEPAPSSSKGPIHWVRANLFSSPLNTVLTLVALYAILVTVPPLIQFYLIDAVWTGKDREACLPQVVGRPVGACWAFVADRVQYFIYGSYTLSERWRVNLVFVGFAISIVWLLWDKLPHKAAGAFFFFAVLPVTAWMLLYGGPTSWRWFMIAAVVMLAWSAWDDYGNQQKGNAAFLTSPVSMIRYGFIAAMLLGGLLIGSEGLPVVDTGNWGGILVTLLIARSASCSRCRSASPLHWAGGRSCPS